MIEWILWLFYLPFMVGMQAQMCVFLIMGVVIGWFAARRVYKPWRI